jgi:hypothetical protein
MALRDQVSHDQGKLGPTGRPGLAEPRSAHLGAGMQNGPARFQAGPFQRGDIALGARV